MREIRPNPGLLKRVEEWDHDALSQVYERYKDLVFTTACAITRNHDDACDVLQDVFAGLPDVIGQYEGRGSFTGWLKKVASNTALIRLRKLKVRREQALERSPEVPDAGGIRNVEDQIDMNDAIDALTKEQRTVFTLRAILGFSYTEICGMLEISETAARSRYHRAMDSIIARMRHV